MEAPDFWDNAEVSQMKMKQLKSLKDDIETYHNLETQMEDMETMIEMGYEENDPEIIPEIQEMLDEFQKDFDNIRIKTLLSGEYDSENAIIKLNAGAGGTEACDWCSMLYRMYQRWADKKGFTTEVLDFLDGDEAPTQYDVLTETTSAPQTLTLAFPATTAGSNSVGEDFLFVPYAGQSIGLSITVGNVTKGLDMLQLQQNYTTHVTATFE